MMDSNLPKTVVELARFNIKGNVIDNGWIENLKFENGKTHMNAVMILSEIIYWYRPVEVRNESTGNLIGFKKKFKADKLQKTYESLGDRFGLSKRQVKLACDYLRDKGLITVEFRNLKSDTGLYLTNVMFLEPVVENILKISCMYDIQEAIEVSNDEVFNLPITTYCNTILQPIVTPNDTHVHTYTENTIENTTKDKTMIYMEMQSEYSDNSKDNIKVAEEDSSLVKNTFSSDDIEKEATILLEKMPNLLGMGNFTNAYRDKRRLHSKEELFRTVDRYLELTVLVGWDKFIGCTNFFRDNRYVEYLDINWDKTLANVKNQLKLYKKPKYSSSRNSRSQTLEDIEYDKQLKEAFGGLLDDND